MPNGSDISAALSPDASRAERSEASAPQRSAFRAGPCAKCVCVCVCVCVRVRVCVCVCVA